MGSFKTQDWNSSKEKNFKARTKKKQNSFSSFSDFDDDLESENYPQLNRYKKQDHRSIKHKGFKSDFEA